MTISSFTGQYHFLSNFSPSRVSIRVPKPAHPGESQIFTVDTVEHAFQALKVDPAAWDFKMWVQLIATARTPGEAKRLARKAPLVPHWDIARVDVMRNLLTAKFYDYTLRTNLIATAPHSLVEGNAWGDKFWGVDSATGEGENMLGQLLEHVRAVYISQRK